jgi:ribosomal protein L16 Arg81 hydroxylase
MLRPGDVLYVPRGIWHDATSQGTQHSLHLTIGIVGQSWGDALRVALHLMEEEDPELRQLFPMWRLAEGGVSDELVQDFAKRLSALATRKVAELTSQQLLSKLATERMAMIARGLIAPAVAPNDRLYLSDSVHHFVIPRADGTAELRWAGDPIPLTAEELSWMVRLDEGASASDLGGAEALAFCQKLAACGLITVEPAIAAKAAE